MYDDDEFRAELRTAEKRVLRCVLIVADLCIVGVLIWALIIWIAG